jgi:iron-sulfur cluster repair protein YtfE (RIC family)
MQACVGDRIVIKGHDVGDPDRDGEIIEVRGPDGTPPFVVRWDDNGHETLFFPGPDATVEHLGPDQEVHHTIGEEMRSEHADLWRIADRLLAAADSLDADTLSNAVHDAYRALQVEVLPHAKAEETALYPTVAGLLGAPAATAPMVRQHVEIGRLVERLGELRDRMMIAGVDADRAAMRQTLYALHAVLTLHLATEEELYLPLLERRLSSRRSQELAGAVENAMEQGGHRDIEPAGP